MMTESTLLVLADCRLVCNIAKPFFCFLDSGTLYTSSDGSKASGIEPAAKAYTATTRERRHVAGLCDPND
jgi:hypothetical protein